MTFAIESVMSLLELTTPIPIRSDDPPFLILHGDRDNTVPIGQSELLHSALKKAGVDSTFFVVKGAGHGFKNRPDLDPMVNDFSAKHLKPGGAGR